MLCLVVPQRDQTLPPIEVAVGQQAEALLPRHGRIEVRQVVGRDPRDIACVQCGKNHQQASDIAFPIRLLPMSCDQQKRERIEG